MNSITYDCGIILPQSGFPLAAGAPRAIEAADNDAAPAISSDSDRWLSPPRFSRPAPSRWPTGKRPSSPAAATSSRCCPRRSRASSRSASSAGARRARPRRRTCATRLPGTGIKVKVGLREGSASMEEAAARPASKKDGTLGEMYDVIRETDLVLLLISDAAQAENVQADLRAPSGRARRSASVARLPARPPAERGRGLPQATSTSSPSAPRAWARRCAGSTSRAKRSTAPASTRASPSQQDVNGKATDYALGWSVALGSPYTFQTTLESEYKSDIFGERGILLGAVHGIVESL